MAGAARADGLLLDLPGRRLELQAAEVRLLQQAAAGRAGSCSRARDLALLFERALAGKRTLALRPPEARTVARLALGLGMHDLAARLDRTS